MGKRGPAPKPTEMRLLHGDRKDRINAGEPLPGTGEVVRPSWLAGDAVVLWDELAADLEERGVLTAWDVPAFAACCWWFGKWREAAGMVDSDGILVEGYRGSQVKNPAHQVARDSWSQFEKLAGRFGLTPSDRAQLSVDAPAAMQAKDPSRLLS